MPNISLSDDEKYEILFDSRIEADLNSLPHLIANKIVEKIKEILPQNPFYGKQLKGNFKGFRGIKLSGYRIIYTIENKTIKVVKIDDRKDVYKILK